MFTTVAVVLAGFLTGPVTLTPAAPASAAPQCLAAAPDETTAATMASACESSVEVLSARTERQQVFVEPNGDRRLRASAAPERVRRANGSWAAISTNLVKNEQGYVPVASPADVAFSAGGDGPFVTWRENGSTFELRWPGKLPAPTITGARATYPSVLPGVDLHATATAEGFVHTVEVKNAAALANPAIQKLAYHTGGDMRVSTTTSGAVRLSDKQGQPVAIARAPLMWDSSTDPAIAGEVLPEVAAARAAGMTTVQPEPATPAEPGVTSRTAPVKVDAANGVLTVEADQSLLANPKLTYPVFIDPQFEKQRREWAYATSNGENNETTRARVGRQPYPDGGNGERYRSFYGFNVGSLAGKHILNGTVRIKLDHSWSCGPTWINAFRVAAITVSSGGRMSWGTRPLPSSVHLDPWQGNANESGGCGSIQPDVDAEFTGTKVRDDLQYFANGKWSNYAVGLCACNKEGEYESEQDRWKKFYTDKAYLEVTYNSYPSTPANLTSAGKTCGSTIGTASVKLRAQYLDADGAGDSLQGTYVYKQLPSGSPITVTDPVTRPGNNYGEVTVNLGSVAEGRTYSWQMRTKDATGDYSPWSAWCNFTVNSKAGAVDVTSADYPDDGTAHGGPGVAGSFTFAPAPNDPGSANIVSYTYGWTNPPSTRVTVAAGGSVTVTLTPPRQGLNQLFVFGANAAGVPGSLVTHTFLTGSPAAALAHWPLSTIDSALYQDVTGDADLVVDPAGTDVAWRADTRLLGERTLRFDATPGGTPGWLRASGTGLDTSNSFSAAAWVRLDTTSCTGTTSAVSMDGTSTSGFGLGFDCATRTWRMRVPDSDQAGRTLTEVASAKQAVAGRWTHLVGSYDEAERKVRLYVDGALTEATPASAWLTTRATGWKATGPVVVGRDRQNGAASGYFVGEIGDVRVWNRVVVADDILGTTPDPANGVFDIAGLLAPIEVGAWTFNGALAETCADAFSDGTYWSPEPILALSGCTEPYSATQTSGYTADGFDDNDALWLNHSQPDGEGTAGQGYAATSAPVMRTDQSFSVSAWVRLADLDRKQALIAQDGANASSFRLEVDPAAGNAWCFRLTHTDTPGAASTAACGSAAKADGSWQQVTGVYDAGAQQLRLYVDGERVAAVAYTTMPWQAGQSTHLGRQKYTTATGTAVFDYLRGTVDQVHMYAGAMGDRQAERLCACS